MSDMSGANGSIKRLHSTPTSISKGKTSPKRGMATKGRVSPADVRSIFESLHYGKPPPSGIQFQIVPVGPTGLKLSPPSYEFEDGLYVLLRPQKKRKNSSFVDQPKAPEHLDHLVMKETPPETCRWSLSGPQFPRPTAIQQRYCYPKGRHEYCSRKGGSLWTMYGTDGEEDTEYRLLHVYFSLKRAANRGISVPDEEVSSPGSASIQHSVQNSPAPKRFKRYPHFQSPPRMTIQGGHDPRSPFNPCASITTGSKSPSVCNSPLSFDAFPPLSPGANFNHLPHFENSNFVSPNSDPFRRYHHYPGSPKVNQPTPSPFRRQHSVAHHHHNIHHSPLQRNALKDDTNDLFPLADMGATFHEIDSYWNDPLLNIMLKPSHDPEVDGSNPEASDSLSTENSPKTSPSIPPHKLSSTTPSTTPVANFSIRLETLHESIRERILAAPEHEQATLVKLVSSWASEIANDPLSGLTLVATTKVTKEEDQQDDTNAEKKREQPEQESPPLDYARV